MPFKGQQVILVIRNHNNQAIHNIYDGSGTNGQTNYLLHFSSALALSRQVRLPASSPALYRGPQPVTSPIHFQGYPAANELNSNNLSQRKIETLPQSGLYDYFCIAFV